MTIQEEQCRIKNCQFRSRSKATACIVTLLCVPMSVCQAGFALPATPPREVLLLRSRNHLPALIDSRIRTFHQSTRIRMSSEVDDEFRNNREPSSQPKADEDSDQDVTAAPVQKMLSSLQDGWKSATKLPPIQVDDANVLFYDIFLLINLTVSLSFWAVHRLKFEYLWSAFSEGCLLSVLWIAAGLYSGAFLFSAVNGHYAAGDERGGPKAAGLLAFHTFVNAINLRLVVALALAVLQHRTVGSTSSEQLIPLEVGFGLVLMSAWRAIHSSYISRL